MLVDHGEVVVCVTNFDRDGRFDLDLTERHLRRVMAHVRTVMVGGSGTEEGFSLSSDERRELLVTAVALGRELGVSVRLNGLEPRTSEQLKADVQLALDVGADAIHAPILDAGHGYRPSEAELLAYGADAIEDTDGLPVYVSSSQVMGHVFPLSVLEKFAEYPHVKGIVVGAPTEQYLGSVLDRFAERWNVQIAGTGYLFNGLALGAKGFVSPEGNVVPDVSRAVAEAAVDGRWTDVKDAVAALLSVTNAIRPVGLTVGIKAALRGLAGLPTYVRPPRIDTEDAVAAVIIGRIREASAVWQRKGSE